jgi:hypothetical protein
MFENLDDPQPPTPAPIEGVAARGRKLRMHRRMIAGALVAFVLAGTIATAAALQGDGHNKVVVSNEPSTTTVSDTAATTSTTLPETTTTVDSAATPTTVAAVAPGSTTTTQPPHDPTDLSKVTVAWPSDSYPTAEGCPTADPCHNVFSFEAGTSANVTYFVTNTGPWPVIIGNCGAVDLWTKPATSAWAPYTEGIWPQPYPARGADAAPPVCTAAGVLVAPGTTLPETETLYAGYRNQYGQLMPAPPGFTSFRPSFLPQCAQPCDWNAPHSLAITISAPSWPPPGTLYTVAVKTLHPKAAAGDSAPVEVVYSNPLGFTVRMPLWGPCWTVKSGPATVDCSHGRPEVIIRGFATVDLIGTIWARKGFVATGAPLATGQYKIDLGDLQGSAYALGGEFPYLTVTP